MSNRTTGTDTIEPGRVRHVWQLLEPLHAVLYYAPEAYEEAAALGFGTGERWPSYFAWRASPLGAVGSARVASLFYSFNPEMVGRYVPAAWDVASPEAVLAARERAVDRTYRTLLGDRVDSPELAEAAGLARRAAEAAEVEGRPLAAANAALAWPDAPHLVLWQAATVLREHRGDGHLAALRAAELDPVEALVSFAAVGAAPEETFQSRQWSAADWAAARERLVRRGLLEPHGPATATAEGHALRAEVERATDGLAAGPYEALGSEGLARLAALLGDFWVAAIGSGLLPMTTTLGIGKA
ncbi:hypothetical protein ACIPW5_05690 [Streptomyces sp. NPDC090077]|uniref:SCO6745 family protein n=1 Tax=Streptomyces sp. NPDC090077 TaxID=3365938 RepID=UPI0038159C5F